VKATPDAPTVVGPLSYVASDLGHVRGHRQVTDAYS